MREGGTREQSATGCAGKEQGFLQGSGRGEAGMCVEAKRHQLEPLPEARWLQNSRGVHRRR